jgi:hypothetical protein
LENCTLVSIPKNQNYSLTLVFSYVLSLLANLNARGQSNTEAHINDISTPQIAVGSPQQQTDEGDGLPSQLQLSAVAAPGNSLINAVKQGAPAIEDAANVTTESAAFPAQSENDIIEISAQV